MEPAAAWLRRALVLALCLLALSARAFDGTIHLADDERAGGHTIARHVGKDEAALRARLAGDPRLSRTSSFATLADAEAAVNAALRANAAPLRAWLHGDPADGRPRAFRYAAGHPLGYGIDRRTWQLRPWSRAVVVLRRTHRLARGFYVLTAYPEP